MVTGHSDAVVYATQADSLAKVKAQSRTRLSGGTARLIWLGDMSTMKIGDDLKPVVVETAKVSADGTYSLSHTPTAAELTALKGNDGWLDITVEVTSPSGATGSFGTSRRWSGTSWANPERADMTATTPFAVDVPIDRDGKARASAVAPSSQAASALACIFRLESYPIHSTRIGLLHNASNSNFNWSYVRPQTPTWSTA